MSRWFQCGLLILLAVVWTGCEPSFMSPQEEERDPHFLAGQERARAADIQGAVEEFEAALENNPKSGAAHLELGLLNEQKRQDFAEAIYHYQRFLRLRPKSTQAENIRERIRACKSDLARTEVIAPVTASLQRDLASTTTANVQLRSNVEMLERKIQELEAQLRSRPQVNLQPQTPVFSRESNIPQADEQTPAPMAETPRQAPVRRNAAITPSPRTDPPAARVRIYKVRSGDTVVQVAKKYGVSVQAVIRANPGMKPERLQIGQELKMPSK
jgi:LysM repeat protein